jgi:hypothetical protein
VQVSVRATNASGTGAATVRTSAAGTVPYPPSSVRGVLHPGTAALRWSPPASNGGLAVTGYTVTRSGRDTAGHMMAARRLPAGTCAITLRSLAGGRGYTVTIRAVNAAGSSVPLTVRLSM